jgi:hypothetical protein
MEGQLKRRLFLTLITAALAAPPLAHAQLIARRAKLYKNPQCGCCEEYAKYLRSHGFEVDVVATPDLEEIRRDNGVPDKLGGCHTTLIGGYVVEGHVPVEPLKRMLRERPDIRGIALPGMPLGSPGMTGRKTGSFKIYAIAMKPGGEPRLYAEE